MNLLEILKEFVPRFCAEKYDQKVGTWKIKNSYFIKLRVQSNLSTTLNPRTKFEPPDNSPSHFRGQDPL